MKRFCTFFARPKKVPKKDAAERLDDSSFVGHSRAGSAVRPRTARGRLLHLHGPCCSLLTRRAARRGYVHDHYHGNDTVAANGSGKGCCIRAPMASAARRSSLVPFAACRMPYPACGSPSEKRSAGVVSLQAASPKVAAAVATGIASGGSLKEGVDRGGSNRRLSAPPILKTQPALPDAYERGVVEPPAAVCQAKLHAR